MKRARPLLSRRFSMTLTFQTKVSENVWICVSKHQLPSKVVLLHLWVQRPRVVTDTSVVACNRSVSIRAVLWTRAHWPPGALSPSLPRSLGPQVLKKLEGNSTDKSGRAVSHRTFLLPPPRCLNPAYQAIPRSGKPTFPTKSFHASSKPTVTPVPSGLLTTIIFSYFIFQVGRRFLDGWGCVLSVFSPSLLLKWHPRAFNFLFCYAEELPTSFQILELHLSLIKIFCHQKWEIKSI